MDDREGKRKNQKLITIMESNKILGIAFLGGMAGYLAGIPGGVILGAMFAICLIHVKTDFIKGSLPKAFPFMLQVLIGTIIGVKFNLTHTEVIALLDFLIPSLLITFVLVITSFISTLVVHKLFGWDLTTAWLATSPGRMQDMLIIAHDLNCDYEKIVSTHTSRIIAVVMITPIILSLGL